MMIVEKDLIECESIWFNVITHVHLRNQVMGVMFEKNSNYEWYFLRKSLCQKLMEKQQMQS